MLAKSIKVKSTGVIKRALDECMRNEFKPSLAIIFISIKQGSKTVADLIHQKGVDFPGTAPHDEIGIVKKGNQDFH